MRLGRDRGSVTVLAIVALSAACSETNSNPGAAGSGGSSGTATGGTPTGGAGVAGGLGGTAGSVSAGTSGTAGRGSSGAGSGGTGGRSLPDDWAECLTDLFARCPLVGSCVESEAEGVTHTCYPDGSRTESEEVPNVSCGPEPVERVYGSDGSLCYTVRGTRGPGCENPSTSYLDGEGNSVAVSSGPNAFAPTPYSFTCAGEDSVRFVAPPPLPLPARPICEPGVCPSGAGGMASSP